MKSEKITIQGDLKGKEDALAAAEAFIQKHGITGKNALHLRLLTEESVCMVHGIMDQFRGTFSLDSEQTDEGLMCRIRVSADSSANEKQEGQLLSVSSSGKNESAKGILGKIREAFRISMQHSEETLDPDSIAAMESLYTMGAHRWDKSVTNTAYERYWSLSHYKKNLSEEKKDNSEEWDELERSIIARLADDVKVWLKNEKTEVVIEKLIKQ